MKNSTLKEKMTLEEMLNNIVEISVNEINMSESIMRKYVEDDAFDELCKSIQTVGLINAITVHKKGNAFFLIAGSRRLMACRRIGRKTIQAHVMQGDLNNLMKIQYAENVTRKDVTLIEECEYLKRCKELLNLTNEQLANMLHKSNSYITKRIQFLDMIPIIKEAVLEGKISFNNSFFISHANSFDKVKYLISFLEERKMRDVDLKNYVEQINSQDESNNDVDEYNEGFDLTKNINYVEPRGVCDVCGKIHNLVDLKLIKICPQCIADEIPE